jgi:hypothetical protein
MERSGRQALQASMNETVAILTGMQADADAVKLEVGGGQECFVCPDADVEVL